jgi:hypothetical protein
VQKGLWEVEKSDNKGKSEDIWVMELVPCIEVGEYTALYSEKLMKTFLERKMVGEDNKWVPTARGLGGRAEGFVLLAHRRGCFQSSIKSPLSSNPGLRSLDVHPAFVKESNAFSCRCPGFVFI